MTTPEPVPAAPPPPIPNRADRRARAAGKTAIRPVWSKNKR